MRQMNDQIRREALEFAARWGFLTKDLFYDFICRMSSAQNYRYWRSLTEDGHFVQSQASENVLLLAHKSRRKIFGESARPSRLPAYIGHDSIAARFLMTLQQTGLVSRYWLENDLMSNPLDTYDILGSARVHRIPDVVFDLKTSTGVIRCAFEVEKTTKTQSRYSKIGLAYLDYSKINLILFACGSLATEVAVSRGFQGKAFTDTNRVPGIFQYPDFTALGLKTKIRFGTREYSIQNFLEVVTKQIVAAGNSKRNLNEKSISFRNSLESEVA